MKSSARTSFVHLNIHGMKRPLVIFDRPQRLHIPDGSGDLLPGPGVHPRNEARLGAEPERGVRGRFDKLGLQVGRFPELVQLDGPRGLAVFRRLVSQDPGDGLHLQVLSFN